MIPTSPFQREKSMTRPTKQQKARQRNITIGAVGIGSAVVLMWLFVFGGLAQIQNLAGFAIAEPEPEPTVFSFSIVDGVLGVELDGDDFDGILYETNDLDDFLDFDILKNYTTGVDVDTNDFDDAEKSILVLRLNGTVAHDDDLYGEDPEDDIGPRTYYEQWVIIQNATTNVVMVYQEPSAANVAVLNATTFGSLDLSSVNVTTTDNITVICGTNASELTTGAKYVAVTDYSVEFMQKPNILVEFNSTVAIADFSLRGTDVDRYNSTTLKFEFQELGPVPISFYGHWSIDAINDADLEIVSVSLYYGDTLLSS